MCTRMVRSARNETNDFAIVFLRKTIKSYDEEREIYMENDKCLNKHTIMKQWITFCSFIFGQTFTHLLHARSNQSVYC